MTQPENFYVLFREATSGNIASSRRLAASCLAGVRAHAPHSMVGFAEALMLAAMAANSGEPDDIANLVALMREVSAMPNIDQQFRESLLVQERAILAARLPDADRMLELDALLTDEQQALSKSLAAELQAAFADG